MRTGPGLRAHRKQEAGGEAGVVAGEGNEAEGGEGERGEEGGGGGRTNDCSLQNNDPTGGFGKIDLPRKSKT